MTKELAKTLTTALVQFIDSERPEGSMCCSNTDCENIRAAFEEGEYDCVEAFIQKKLSRLTEFEQEVSDIVEYCKENGENVAFDYAKRHAKTLLAIAREQFKPEINAEIEKAYKTQDDVVFRKGWEQGRTDALKDLPRWRAELGDMEYVAYGIIGGGIASEENPRVYLNGRSIDLYSLRKLPGFNED